MCIFQFYINLTNTPIIIYTSCIKLYKATNIICNTFCKGDIALYVYNYDKNRHFIFISCYGNEGYGKAANRPITAI